MKSWYQSVDGRTWDRCMEPWCPRCQRPVVFHIDRPAHLFGAAVEDYVPQKPVVSVTYSAALSSEGK